MGSILEKRVYDPSEESDGYRILVDRLWPRGFSKERVNWNQWAKEIAPSNGLRVQYHKKQIDQAAFTQAYLAEIKENPLFTNWTRDVLDRLSTENVTLLTASKDIGLSQVGILKQAVLHEK